MTKQYLNAAITSIILDDISCQFMNYHDDINDLKINEEKYDVDLLLIRFFGNVTNEKQLPFIRAILMTVCEYASTLSESETDLDIDAEQLEFEF